VAAALRRLGIRVGIRSIVQEVVRAPAKLRQRLQRPGVRWIPSRITLEHFQEAWAKAPCLTYYKNSLVVATVVLPLIKPTVAAVAMLLFLSSWNDFLWPVIVINSESLRTLPVGIALFKDPYGFINYGPLMAGTVITIGPMLVAYAFSQRFMIRGIALTGLR